MPDLLAEAVSLLRSAEWASTRWTDYPVCPWCNGGQPGTDDPKLATGHKDDCPFVAFMKSVEAHA